MEGLHGNDADSHRFALSIMILNIKPQHLELGESNDIFNSHIKYKKKKKGRKEASYFLFSRGKIASKCKTKQGSLGHSNEIFIFIFFSSFMFKEHGDILV